MKKNIFAFILILTLLIPVTAFSQIYDFGDGSSKTLATKAWGALEKNNFKAAIAYADKCIASYGEVALEQQAGISEVMPDDEALANWALNEVAISYFVKGKALKALGKKQEAVAAFQFIQDKLSYAICWDDGTQSAWKVAAAAKDQIFSIKKGIDFGDYISATLSEKAWKSLNKKKYGKAVIYANKCIELYEKEAKKQQKGLKKFANKKTAGEYWALNDVATCMFIKGKILFEKNKGPEAKSLFQKIVKNFPHAQCWNPKGYYWKVAQAANDEILKIEKGIDFGHYKSSDLTSKAWKAFEKNEFDVVKIYADKCIKLYYKQAIQQQSMLTDFPSKETTFDYWALNDVATCFFIKGKSYVKQNDQEKAKKTFNQIINKFPHAQCFDTQGWFWKVASASKDEILMMETGIDFGDMTSSTLTGKAWQSFEAKDYQSAILFAKKCIENYITEAKKMQTSLSRFPQGDKAKEYWALNDVGTCYYILGNAYSGQKEWDQARQAYKKVIEELFFAQAWDNQGWFWKISVAARKELKKVANKN